MKTVKKIIKQAKKSVKNEENVKVKVLKVKKTPTPKSKLDEAIPMDDHHHDDGPKEEGDDSDEAKDILAEEPAPPAPIPVMKDQPIVDPNPVAL